MSAIAFVQAKRSAPRLAVTDLTGKVLHVGDKVVTFKNLRSGSCLISGRIITLSPIRAIIVEDESEGYSMSRVPSQLSRID